MNTNNTINPALLTEKGNGKILVCLEYSHLINSDWFLPSFWGSSARPVKSGGRGMAWFIENKTMSDCVLRLYGRGGLVVHFNKRTHGFIHKRFVRSFKEFRLLTQLFNAGFKVPRPIAASYHKVAGLGYQAAILIERIFEASSFAELLYTANDQLWMQIGRLIRQFHDAGIYHADLNCNNILVAPSGIYLIDFDKSKFRTGERWKTLNLERLRRSIEKQIRKNSQILPEIDLLWETLLSGYLS